MPRDLSDEEQWDRDLERAERDVIFSRDWLRVMSHKALIVYMVLEIFQGRTKHGWLRCPDRFMANKCRLKGDAARRVLKELGRKGYLNIERRKGNVRWIKLDHDCVYNDLAWLAEADAERKAEREKRRAQR